MIVEKITWPDFPLLVNKNDEVLSPDILASLITKNIQTVTQVQKVNTESRNPVYRMWLKGDACPVIVKWFLPELDSFYYSRYRREEKVLRLLNKWFSNRAPEIYGGIITGNYAVLIEQNVGENSLEFMLNTAADEAQKFRIASQGVELLADFHRVCQKHYRVFYRTCYSTNLDRLTLNTYLRRARIAIGRLLILQSVFEDKISVDQAAKTNIAQLEDLAMAEVGDNFIEWYTARIIIPLIRAPKQILHNSFSPFHLMWSDHWSLIDFETLSIGAAQIDLAEFIGSPHMTLSSEQQMLLVRRYYELRADEDQLQWSEFLENYYKALASRSLDYLGTTTFRCLRYISQQREDRLRVELERARQYRLRTIDALKMDQEDILPYDIPHI